MTSSWARRIATVVVVMMGTYAYGQESAESNFAGDWRGSVTTEDRGEVPFRVRIADGDAVNYYCIERRWNSFDIGSVESRRFYSFRENALLTWIRRGDKWTETQIFSLSYISEETLAITWTRHVNQGGGDGERQTWHMFGHGRLSKRSGESEECEDL